MPHVRICAEGQVTGIPTATCAPCGARFHFARLSRNETLRMVTVVTMQELDLVMSNLAEQHKTVAAKLAKNQRNYCEQVLLQFAQYSASQVPA